MPEQERVAWLQTKCSGHRSVDWWLLRVLERLVPLLPPPPHRGQLDTRVSSAKEDLTSRGESPQGGWIMVEGM